MSVPRVLRRLYASVIGAVLTGFAFLLVTGQYIEDGPVLFQLSPSHGIHRGDLFVITGWMVSTVALVALTLAPGRSRSRPGPRAERLSAD
ncbi:hypothetical protein [Blastococcus deserti]|uniref:Uncharacterized protein n=1 Tax=Blastococcus deserti TaxID=2259033 RepID=A0ABW4XF11_9ACTN